VIRRGAWALAALLTACAAPRAPLPPAQPPPPPPVHASAPAARPPSKPLDATRLPPFDGEKQVVQEPLRGVRLIDLTVQPDDLWQRIRIGFGMPDLDNQRVRDMMAYYVARPDYLQRMFERSRRYLYHIVDELEKRGMPTELALLPMVESAYNPMAYSRSHASGIWQFIPPTGKRYSLKQGWWYDERRDIVASTNAALDYLQDLYDRHGDWQLALASYNWGENAVARAIEKNRKAGLPTDYADLKMPPETRNYIPKLQALKNIINDPKPFGIALDPIPNKPYFVAVDGTGAIDVRLAAKLAEMPVDDFIALNPGFNRPLIPTSLDSRIVLPADKVEVFRANLEKYDQDALVSWKTYHPRHGERLDHIARKFHVPLDELKKVNGIRRYSNRTPSLLVVPTNSAAAHAAPLPIMYAPPIPANGQVHVVRRGESLWSISRHYRVPVSELRRWNKNTRVLHPGQRIIVYPR
jgi:peptidoglycan lytic transglycosylase D